MKERKKREREREREKDGGTKNIKKIENMKNK